MKYTPVGGRVDVGVLAEPEAAVLVVEDSGPGVPADERERVLDRFYRTGEQVVRGSGLGLAIVKSVAVLHGAELTLDTSARLGGLRVMVRFRRLSPA